MNFQDLLERLFGEQTGKGCFWFPAKGAVVCFLIVFVLAIGSSALSLTYALQRGDFWTRNFSIEQSLLPLTVISAQLMQAFLVFLCFKMKKCYMRDIFLAHTWFFLAFTYAAEVFGWLYWVNSPSSFFLVCLFLEYWLAFGIALHLYKMDKASTGSNALISRPISAQSGFWRSVLLSFAAMASLFMFNHSPYSFVSLSFLALAAFLSALGWWLLMRLPSIPEKKEEVEVSGIEVLARTELAPFQAKEH